MRGRLWKTIAAVLLASTAKALSLDTWGLSHVHAVEREPKRTSFYLFTFEEQSLSHLQDCQLTIYGEALYQHLQHHPRRTADLFAAKFAVFPPVFALELNWPTYGGFADNVAKPGRDCYDNTTLALARKLAAARGGGSPPFFVAIFDMDPFWFHHLDPLVYSDPAFSWAQNNALERFFRPQRDVSLPPPIHERSERYKMDMRDLGSNRFLLTFKGRFETSPIRAQLANLHDPSAGIIIVDSADEAGKAFDYNELLSRSNFTLVVRGDTEFSYRFSEAVCSGAVPVVLADAWVIPFEPSIPFDSYGVRIRESDWKTVVDVIRSVSEPALVEKQQNALRVCHNSLANVHLQWNKAIDILLSDRIV